MIPAAVRIRNGCLLFAGAMTEGTASGGWIEDRIRCLFSNMAGQREPDIMGTCVKPVRVRRRARN